MRLKVAVQMDPIERINIRGDSTFALLLEAQAREHEIAYYTPERLAMRDGTVIASVQPLAVRDKAKKGWVYVGHVGTGFDNAALKSIYGMMQPLRTAKKPFDQRVKDENATTWLTPKLVGEVKFSEWTSEGEMRHPAFLGLRTDKKASDVIREQT